MTSNERDPDTSGPSEPGASTPAEQPAAVGSGRPESPEAPEAHEAHEDGAAGTLPDGMRQRVESWVPELVKKAVAAGLGAVFTTEESIRRLTKEMPMPKEVAGYLVNTASSTKDELFRIFAREIREFLSNVNLSEEVAKMLTSLSFEIKTEIRFIPNMDKYAGVEPDVKARVRLKRNESRPRRRMFRRGARRAETAGNEGEGEGEE